MNRRVRTAALVPILLLSTTPAALASDPKVIFTEIPGHPTALVPGALDAGGLPVATDFIAL